MRGSNTPVKTDILGFEGVASKAVVNTPLLSIIKDVLEVRAVSYILNNLKVL